MPGYDNRFKTISFDDLGPGLWVTIRNPKTMPPARLRPNDIPVDGNGNPLNPEQAEFEMYRVLATLVKDWHLYDATSDDDDQPVLPLPATAELVACLPLGVINKMAEELAAATNPQ